MKRFYKSLLVGRYHLVLSALSEENDRYWELGVNLIVNREPVREQFFNLKFDLGFCNVQVALLDEHRTPTDADLHSSHQMGPTFTPEDAEAGYSERRCVHCPGYYMDKSLQYHCKGFTQ